MGMISNVNALCKSDRGRCYQRVVCEKAISSLLFCPDSCLEPPHGTFL